MRFARSVILLLILITALCGSALAQKRFYESHSDRLCAFAEPRTRLEEFEGRLETVVIKGGAISASLNATIGTVRIDVLEYRDTSNSTRAAGIAVRLNNAADNRSLIDYDQIDALIKALDQIAVVDSTVTKLAHFEARYRTRGDLEITVFRQTDGGNIAATVAGGACERVTVQLSLEDLNRLRGMIVQAKTRLNEIK